MTKDQLKAIIARCEAATEGPWGSYDPCDRECIGMCCPSGCQGHPTGWHVVDGLDAYNYDEEIRVSKEDGEFIAHARTDLPACIKEIERLKRLVKSAHREGFSAIEGFAAYDKDDYFWQHSESRKALEAE